MNQEEPTKLDDFRIYDAGLMLECWGLRETGGSLKNPMRLSTGGEAQEDDEKAAMVFVQTTPYFRAARPVLAHVHIQGGRPDSFQVRQPGERLNQALHRLGWWMLFGLREDQVSEQVYAGFHEILTWRLELEGFTPPSKLPKLVDEDEGPVTQREKEMIEAARKRAS